MSPFYAALALLAAQVPTTTVSLDARGEDVREVFATLFAQAKKSYALDASIKGSLYVKLDRMDYDKALRIVLTQSGLFAREKDGVMIVSTKPAPSPKPVFEAKPVAVVPKTPAVVAIPAPVRIAVPSQEATLARKVTTRWSKAPLATVFASLAKQAEVAIVLDPSVPAYLIDANFAQITLASALRQLCQATGLQSQMVDGVIRVSRKKV